MPTEDNYHFSRRASSGLEGEGLFGTLSQLVKSAVGVGTAPAPGLPRRWNFPSESRAGATPVSARRFLVLTGVFLLALFPLLGNGLVFQTGLPRRLGQAIVLFSGLALYLAAIDPRQLSRLWAPVFRSRGFVLTFAVLGGTLLGIATFNLSTTTFHVTAKNWNTFALVLAWLFTFSAAAVVIFSRRYFGRAAIATLRDPGEAGLRRLFLLLVVVTGVFLMTKAWWYGPKPNEAYIDLGGSEIMMAVCGCLGFFVVLFCYPLAVALPASLPYAYLILFSTARTAIMALSVMLVALAIVKFMRPARSFLHRVGSAVLSLVLPLALIFIVLVVPIHLESRWYPFYVPTSQTSVIGPRIEELYNRFSRFLRVLYAMGALRLQSDASEMESAEKIEKFISFLTPDHGTKEGKAKTLKRLQRVLAYSRDTDSRWSMVNRTINYVRRHPMGSWPADYTNMKVYCYPTVLCDYPHNFILEVSYYFGWAMTVLFTTALAVMAAVILRQLWSGANLVVQVSTVCLLVYLLAMQITGTLSDFATPFLLVWIWLTELLGAAPVGAAEKGKTA